jgi:hypothetical protein
MPVVKMPDGAQVQFPDGMPDAQIRDMIASKFPEVAQQAPQQDTFQRSTILPFGKDTATGEVSLAMPGLLKGVLDSAGAAITAPGRAMKGDLPVFGADGNVSPQGCRRPRQRSVLGLTSREPSQATPRLSTRWQRA